MLSSKSCLNVDGLDLCNIACMIALVSLKNLFFNYLLGGGGTPNLLGWDKGNVSHEKRFCPLRHLFALPTSH